MAFIDTAQLDRSDQSPLAFEALMAQLDASRVAVSRQKPATPAPSAHLHHVQQMLLAATMAAGMIIAVAGVMMLKFL